MSGMSLANGVGYFSAAVIKIPQPKRFAEGKSLFGSWFPSVSPSWHGAWHGRDSKCARRSRKHLNHKHKAESRLEVLQQHTSP